MEGLCLLASSGGSKHSDIYWTGERRVVRQNTPVGQSHQYMHLPQGPKKTQYDVANRLKVIGKDVNIVEAPVVASTDTRKH